MDLSSSGIRQPNHRSHKKATTARNVPQQPPPPFSEPGSFDYLSNQQQQYLNPGQQMYYGQGYPADQAGAVPPHSGQYFLGPAMGGGGPMPATFMNDQMTNLAMAYGQSVMGQGKQIVDQKLEQYVPIHKIKYYFAVNTSYVRTKLLLVLFPFANSVLVKKEDEDLSSTISDFVQIWYDWSIKYSNTDDPVAPKYETNAPDLYIPVMSFVTFILLAGFALGIQNKFSPEQLGVHASSTFGWLCLEVVLVLVTSYIINIQTDLSYLDFVAFCSYKYVGMIASVLFGLIFHSTGYYISLLYFSAALAFFLVKTLRIQILPKSSLSDHQASALGTKRRMYLMLFLALFQPLIMFWLTRHLVPQPTDSQL